MESVTHSSLYLLELMKFLLNIVMALRVAPVRLSVSCYNVPASMLWKNCRPGKTQICT